MWSQENKDGLLEHMPQRHAVRLASARREAVGLGGSVSTQGAASETANFVLGAHLRGVHRGRPPRRARLRRARAWWRSPASIPLGYYKDEEKSAKTFRIFEGQRWSVPGDWAEVNADGTLHLLGRGSVCINTGGEKVFPEEVEEALKTPPGRPRRGVVGVPDARFGEAICAVVEPSTPASDVDADDVSPT